MDAAVPARGGWGLRLIEVSRRAKAQRKPVPVARMTDLWLLLLSGVGLVLSAYLVWTRQAHAPVYCPLGSGCEVVQSSRVAAGVGLPVSPPPRVLLGLLTLVA